MKQYFVNVNGVRMRDPIAARDHTEAKQIAEAKYPGEQIQVFLVVDF